tara:strand:+ start:191 stop:913 length:723 start_codon:yes stop_codon:yes gene_type:complete
MSKFLLVHGASHGAWCFEKLIKELQNKGYVAEAIDLPGHGNNKIPLEDVTLEKYSSEILASLDSPTIVLGHSMGGYPVSLAAQTDPTYIKHLIYLTAFVPEDGKTLAELRKKVDRYPLTSVIRKTEDGLGFYIPKKYQKDIFYNDCSKQDIKLASEKLCIQAIKPQNTPIKLGVNFKKVSKSYVSCLDDQTIPIELQKKLSESIPEENKYEIKSGHSPFFSRPADLANILEKIVSKNYDY